MGKLFTLILNDRLTTFLEERNILKPNQIGFRKGYMTSDHVFVLNSMINSYIRKGKKIYGCFFLTFLKHMILCGEMVCFTN